MVVERRIAGDRRRPADRAFGEVVHHPAADHDAAAGEVLGVVGDLGDVLVGQRHPHAVVAIGVGDGTSASRTDRQISGALRLYVRVGMVEVGRPVRHRPECRAHCVVSSRC